MTLIILSDSDTVIPNFLEETHRTCVLNTGLFQVKICIFRLYSGSEASRTLWGLRSDLFFSTKQFRKVRVVPGHSGFSETCFRSHNTK